MNDKPRLIDANALSLEFYKRINQMTLEDESLSAYQALLISMGLVKEAPTADLKYIGTVANKDYYVHKKRTVTKMPADRPSRTAIEKRAIETYGEQSQVDMMIEEMSELTKALLKWRRFHKTKASLERLKMAENDVLEEMADVQIMLDQMKMVFGTTLIVEDAKLKRLAENMGMIAAVGESRWEK